MKNLYYLSQVTHLSSWHTWEERTEELLPSAWPVAMSVRHFVNWCEKTQPTMGSAILGQVGVAYVRNLTEQAREETCFLPWVPPWWTLIYKPNRPSPSSNLFLVSNRQQTRTSCLNQFPNCTYSKMCTERWILTSTHQSQDVGCVHCSPTPACVPKFLPHPSNRQLQICFLSLEWVSPVLELDLSEIVVYTLWNLAPSI